MQIAPLGTARPKIARHADRRITLAAIVVAGGYVVLAGAASLLSPTVWLPLHLLLAGAAGTAICGVLPFFAAALSAGPPPDVRVRAIALSLVSGGGLAIASRALDAPAWLPILGGSAFVLGIGITAVMAVRAGTSGLATRRPIVTLAYVVALLDVMVGGSLAIFMLLGNPSVTGGWERLRPAHAWLNVIGFVSLVITGTLLHLLPTVAGTRIVIGRPGRIAVWGLVAGPPLIAAGLLAAGLTGAQAVGDLLVRLGSLVTLAAAMALSMEVGGIVGRRGRWTSDPGWHRLATGSLAAGVAWYVVGVSVAAGQALVSGATPGAWHTELVAFPLGAGWILQVIVGAATHLIPAIGPGGPAGHAVRRGVLGRGASVRLAALNAGVAALWLGTLFGIELLLLPGALLLAVSAATDLGLLVVALVSAVPGSPSRAAPPS